MTPALLLALLVAAFNALPAAVSMAAITYLAYSACVVLAYVGWQRRMRAKAARH